MGICIWVDKWLSDFAIFIYIFINAFLSLSEFFNRNSFSSDIIHKYFQISRWRRHLSFLMNNFTIDCDKIWYAACLLFAQLIVFSLSFHLFYTLTLKRFLTLVEYRKRPIIWWHRYFIVSCKKLLVKWNDTN